MEQTRLSVFGGVGRVARVVVTLASVGAVSYTHLDVYKRQIVFIEPL